MNDKQNETINSRARRTPNEINRTGGQSGQRRQGTPRPNTPQNVRTNTGYTQRVQTGAPRQSQRTAGNGGSGNVRGNNRGNDTKSAKYVNNNRSSRGTSGVGYRFENGGARTDARYLTAQRTVNGLTPIEENKIVRREEKRELEERKERAWQKDIVRVKGRVDFIMLGIILLLLALGTVAVFSASYPYAISKGLDSNYFIKQQLLFLLLGGVVMTAMALIPIKFYQNWAPIVAYAVSCILLVAVLFIGSKEGEAVRWIRFGSFGIQPSELMKLSIVLMLAWYAQKYEDRMKELDFGFVSYKWNTLFPLCILGFACGLVLIGKHLSGTIIVGGIGFLVLIVAGCKKLWLFLSTAAVGIPAIAAFLALNPYALKRITTFADDNADKLDELYQTTQSIYAIGNGGLTGVGLGESIQKHSYLAASHTDFIFSVWCEEWGFIGAVALILIFMLFMWRGYVIAVRSPDRFTMLTAFGITTHVGLQALLNMMVASDIIMNTGVSLPFFSYGGSSLIVLMFEMGILLAISRQSYRKKKDIEHDEMMRQAGMSR